MRARRPASRAAVALVVMGIALALPSALLAADSTTDPAATTAAETTTTTTTSSTTTAPAAAPPATTTTTTTAAPVATTTTTAAPAPTPIVASATAAKSGLSVSIVDGPSNSDYGYSPTALTVTAGDTVTWTNNGTVPEGHTVTGDGFDSGTLSNGDSYSHTFTSTGTFPYVCTLHPFMKGSVTVEAAPPPSNNGSTGGTSGSDPSGAGSTGGSSPDSSSSATTPTGSTTPTTTGPGSESFGVTSSGAAGDGSSLPTTGSDTWLLGMLGALLTAAGLGLAMRPRHRVRIYV